MDKNKYLGEPKDSEKFIKHKKQLLSVLRLVGIEGVASLFILSVLSGFLLSKNVLPAYVSILFWLLAALFGLALLVNIALNIYLFSRTNVLEIRNILFGGVLAKVLAVFWAIFFIFLAYILFLWIKLLPRFL